MWTLSSQVQWWPNQGIHTWRQKMILGGIIWSSFPTLRISRLWQGLSWSPRRIRRRKSAQAHESQNMTCRTKGWTQTRQSDRWTESTSLSATMSHPPKRRLRLWSRNMLGTCATIGPPLEACQNQHSPRRSTDRRIEGAGLCCKPGLRICTLWLCQELPFMNETNVYVTPF
jgi:hypothetical protein